MRREIIRITKQQVEQHQEDMLQTGQVSRKVSIAWTVEATGSQGSTHREREEAGKPQRQGASNTVDNPGDNIVDNPLEWTERPLIST